MGLCLAAALQLGAPSEARAQNAPVYELPPFAPFEITDDVRVSAAAGVAQAQVQLGLHLLGVGGDDNLRSAMDLLVAAARQGYPPALLRLAEMHRSGSGPGLDPEATLPLVERAAELGDSRAVISAAQLLFVEPGRVPRGIAFFSALAEHGSQQALQILIPQLLSGRAVPPDFATAVRLLRENDGAWAQLWLAALHAKGAGVPLDVARARALEEAALASATILERLDFALQLAIAAPGIRDGDWAVRVAEAVVEDPATRSPTHLGTLSEIYAALGRYDDAVDAMEEAVAGLASGTEVERAYRPLFEERLALFRRRAEAAGARR